MDNLANVFWHLRVYLGLICIFVMTFCHYLLSQLKQISVSILAFPTEKQQDIFGIYFSLDQKNWTLLSDIEQVIPTQGCLHHFTNCIYCSLDFSFIPLFIHSSVRPSTLPSFPPSLTPSAYP